MGCRCLSGGVFEMRVDSWGVFVGFRCLSGGVSEMQVDRWGCF